MTDLYVGYAIKNTIGHLLDAKLVQILIVMYANKTFANNVLLGITYLKLNAYRVIIIALVV